MKRISEITDCGATVVLNKGKIVARVLSRYSRGGTVQVDVVQYSEAAQRTAKVLGLKDWGEACLQQGKAGGYGYDKYTAALSGLVIDGHRMSNHCGGDDATVRLLKAYERAMDAGKGEQDQTVWDARAKKIGARFANWKRTRADHIDYMKRRGWSSEEAETEADERGGFAPRVGRYSSLYRLEGLEYLRAIGYTVETIL